MAALSHRPSNEANILHQASESYHHSRYPPPLTHYASAPRSSTSERSPTDLTSPAAASAHHHRHPISQSPTSVVRSQRPSKGLFNRAAAALDRTQSVLATISEPVIRYRQSNSALARLSLASDPASNSDLSSPNKNASVRNSVCNASLSSALTSDITVVIPAAEDLPSQPYSETDPSLPAPIRLIGTDKKMHQTSSRLLRMTDEDRPFTRVC